VSSGNAARCRQKFLRFFPKGFQDEKYLDWERGYKWKAHESWNEVLDRAAFAKLLKAGQFAEIAAHAARIESRTNLLFSFEKMALRDAIKSQDGTQADGTQADGTQADGAQADGAQAFATGLYEFLHGTGRMERKFEQWCEVIEALPRKQTRVLTHPVVTVFSFIAQPDKHIYLKPNVTRTAAKEYGFEIRYQSRPSWETYVSLLQFADIVKSDLQGTGKAHLNPRDMMDIQSFLWVQGSDEYEE
jgi:hypothetical protein